MPIVSYRPVAVRLLCKYSTGYLLLFRKRRDRVKLTTSSLLDGHWNHLLSFTDLRCPNLYRTLSFFHLTFFLSGYFAQ